MNAARIAALLREAGIDYSIHAVEGADRTDYIAAYLAEALAGDDDTGTLTYTQHTVAFPTNRLMDDDTDGVGVSLDAKGGGTHGEFQWRFVTFRNMHDTKAVQLTVFGDGLPCFFDPRVQQVVQQWREMPDPDEMTPKELCGLLEAAGAVPSRYMPVPS